MRLIDFESLMAYLAQLPSQGDSYGAGRPRKSRIAA